MQKAFITVFLLMLVKTLTQGSTETRCELMADTSILTCTFPGNINSSQSEFSVFFRPEDAFEELLVECVWLGGQLKCITQEGFECKLPVSNSAVIVMPRRYANRSGLFKCVSEVFKQDAEYCQYPQKPVNKSPNLQREREQIAKCEINSSLEKQEAVLKCSFSFSVQNFSIQYINTVVANYTKANCERSSICRYQPDETGDAFFVVLDLSQSASGEYFCLPDIVSKLLALKGCSQAERSEDSPALLEVVTSIVSVLILVSVAVAVTIFCIRRKVAPKTEDMDEKAERKLMDIAAA